MLPFRKILFPVDYSPPCDAVIPYVLEMTRRFSAELTVVHAYGAEALASSELPLTDPDLPNEAHAYEAQRLQDFARAVFPGEHVESIAQLGEPGTVIDHVVQHQGADLVMLPTHGRGPIRRLLLGSVTAKVLHDISAAVWTGTGSYFTGHSPALPYKSVLCALDDTEEAESVLKAAATLACAYQARLSLVRVIAAPAGNSDIDLIPYTKELADAADVKLRELKGQLGIDAPHTVVEGLVSECVRQEAVRKKADLIVTGRGQVQSTFSRMWSQLYPIVRESPCPVLSI